MTNKPARAKRRHQEQAIKRFGDALEAGRAKDGIESRETSSSR
jgi:hypothetical protein